MTRRERMVRRWRGARVVILMGVPLLAIACGGGDGGGTVAPPAVTVAVVEVAPSTGTLEIGQTLQLTATAKTANGATVSRTFAWTSSEVSKATVSSTGLVTGVAEAGSITISATADGRTGVATLQIKPPAVASITLEPAAGYLYVGESGSYVVTLKDAAGASLTNRTVSWTSSAPAIATVAGTGVVTGISPGVATITATSEGKSTTATLTVLAPPAAVATITLAPSPASLALGEAGYFTVTLRDATGNVLTGRPITWTSSLPSVASVAADGMVSGIALGSTVITATSEGKSTSATVTVVPRAAPVAPVASVTLQPATASLYVGAAGYFGVVLRDAAGNVLTGRVITWTSSAPAIASVGSDGLVIALAPGSATITATSEGRQGAAVLTVVPAPTASPSVCTQIAGGRVIATDGKFIGSLTNRYDSESVLNPYGRYGGKYEPLSIYYQYGEYGSRYSLKSAYNPYTTTPPRITFTNGTFVWLTVSTAFAGTSVSPDLVKTCTNFP
jgi:uncharacterized protein YjdB